jgi:error-prone DNA polymerase
MNSRIESRSSSANERSSERAKEYSPGREPRVTALKEEAPKERQKSASGSLVGSTHHWPATDDRRPTIGNGTIALRLGLRYVKGLHEEVGQVIVRERRKGPFDSIDDLARRVPELSKKELNTLAEIGALNSIRNSPRRHPSTALRAGSGTKKSSEADFFNVSSVSPCLRGEDIFHRRDALWSASAAANRFGPLLENIAEPDHASPLKKMTDEERLVADFRGTGLTTGPHPMTYHRARMNKLGVRRSIELAKLPGGRPVRIAGGVIARQRPGTAKGFVFLSLEDETGVANAIINPDLFQKNRLLLATEQFLLIEGILQNQDGVISVKAARVAPLKITRAQTASHDFH